MSNALDVVLVFVLIAGGGWTYTEVTQLRDDVQRLLGRGRHRSPTDPDLDLYPLKEQP